METTTKKRGGLFALCPAAHVIALLGAAVIALHLALRHNYALMRRLSDGFVQVSINPDLRDYLTQPLGLDSVLTDMVVGLPTAAFAVDKKEHTVSASEPASSQISSPEKAR